MERLVSNIALNSKRLLGTEPGTDGVAIKISIN